MINLIKNELTKIFHKKTIYVFLILIAGIGLLNVVLTKVAEKLLSDEMFYNMIDTNIDSYNMDDPYEKDAYISNKTDVDTYSYIKEYDEKSWEYYYLSNNLPSSIRCKITAEVDKNQEEKEKCEEEIESILHTVEIGDWKQEIIEKKEQNNQEINDLKAQYELTENSKQKQEIEKEIKRLEYQIEGYNYHLNLNVAPSNEPLSLTIDEYVNNSINLLEYSKDEKTYTDRKELVQKREYEKIANESKYKLDNNIKLYDENSAIGMMKTTAESPSFIILIAVVLIAATSIAEEFNKGTIKQLLLKPYTRSKILLSKYITIILMFVLLTVYSFIVNLIVSGIMGGFESLSSNIIIYNFTTNSIETMGIIKYSLLYFASFLPMYFILFTLAFLIAVISGNTAISMSISIAYYMVSNIITILSSLGSKYAIFLPSNNWMLSTYLFGGLSINKYLSFASSLTVCIITFAILIVLSFIIFKKKDIKNQ